MGDVNLAASEQGDDEKPMTSMQEYNLALKACGFGWYNIRLLIASFMGGVSGVLVTIITPYVLPMAECDLNMGLVRKGILNATPYIGMLASSIIAGILTDTFGRKIFLVTGFGGMFIFTFISGFSQSYEVLLASNLMCGLIHGGAFSARMVHISEFCHSGIRDQIMLINSSFASFAQIIVAFISWAILLQDWKVSFFNGSIVLNTWNYYILIMSLWSLFTCIQYAFLPETPKYCITQHRYDEARETLIQMYKQNTGKPAETYPFINIWKDKAKQIGDEAAEVKGTALSEQVINGLRNILPMFKRPLIFYLVLICFMNCFTMLVYDVIRLWFPQLSTIVEHYTVENQDLCMMLDQYTHDLKVKIVNVTATEICVPVKSGMVTYINSVILGCICLLPYAVTGVLVNKVGKKTLLLIATTASIAGTLGLRWSSSKAAIVGLFSLDASMTQTAMSLIQATTLELFPTTTRTLAMSMIMTFGRIGSLVGNVTFPILLNISCVIPFFTMAGLMICITVMAMLLPQKKK